MTAFDGAEGDVFDESGRRVSSVALDDQRTPGSGAEILGCFEEADPEWAERLPRSGGAWLDVAIELPNGERYEDVRVKPPRRDTGGPVHSLYFPLSHPDF